MSWRSTQDLWYNINMMTKAEKHKRLREAMHSSAIEGLPLTDDERKVLEYFVDNDVPEDEQDRLALMYLAGQWAPPRLEAAE